MKAIVSRTYSILRSRRVALWLICLVVAYSFIVTLIPQEYYAGTDEVARWAAAFPGIAPIAESLGLHNAYSAPLFLILATLLVLTTIACSWERSRVAIRSLTEGDRVSRSQIDRLYGRPHHVIPLSGGEDPQSVLQAALDAVASLGLKGKHGPRLMHAASRRWALPGSPLFHWSLALLFLFSGAGQATKWEGKVLLPVNHPIPDVVESYAFLRAGILAQPAGTGLTMVASEFEEDLVDRGIERGFSAVLTLEDERGMARASQYVYPNRPLRFGSHMFHREDWGMSVVLTLDTPEGEEAGRRYEYFDFPRVEEGGRIRNVAEIPPEIGLESMEVALPLDEAPDDPGSYLGRIPESLVTEVTLTLPSGEIVGPIVMAVDDTLEMPEGDLVLRVADITPYLVLLVVDDWSIPLIYAFLTLATIGGTVALIYPPRTVLCALVDYEDGSRTLNVLVRSRKVDPVFPGRVRAVLEEAVLARDEDASSNALGSEKDEERPA